MAKKKIAVREKGDARDDGRFAPTEFTEEGALGSYPKCYGHYISGRKCNCEWEQSCVVYTYDNIGERSRTVRFRDFETQRFREGMDFIIDEGSGQVSIDMEGTEDLDVSEINLRLITMMTWFALEKPGSAKALVLKLDPRVRCLEDIATILGISKQAVQRRVAHELGIGKRAVKEDKVLRLSEAETLVYQMHFKEGVSLRKTGAEVGISHESVRKIVKKLERLGFSRSSKQQQEKGEKQ